MKQLLIVDDEVKICTILSDFFSARGIETMTAHSGRQALDCLKQKVPDCVLLDVKMPDGSGFFVLETAKEWHPQLRIIMLSAFNDEDIIAKAYRLGADDFMTKPISLAGRDWHKTLFGENGGRDT